MSQDASFTPELIKTVVPTSQASVRRALRSLGNPVAKLRQLRQLVSVLVKQLSRKSASFPLGVTDRVSAADRERDRGIEADEVCGLSGGRGWEASKCAKSAYNTALVFDHIYIYIYSILTQISISKRITALTEHRDRKKTLMRIIEGREGKDTTGVYYVLQLSCWTIDHASLRRTELVPVEATSDHQWPIV